MLRECEGEGNVGVGEGDMWVVHVVQVLCLAQLTWDERSWWSMRDVYVFGLGRCG